MRLRAGRAGALVTVAVLTGTAAAGGTPEVAAKAKKPDLPPFSEVSEGYEKVVSRADGSRSLYTIWSKPKEHQMLAELGSGFEGQKIFIATSIAGGNVRTGW